MHLTAHTVHLAASISTSCRVDRQLSTPTAAVFVNYHTQMVLVAFRGSVTLGDWASNAKTVLPRV